MTVRLIFCVGVAAFHGLALALPGLATAQPTGRVPLPGVALPRGERITKDARPAGPAPGMIYGRALGPTSTRVVWSQIPAANGYQLYRSEGAVSTRSLVNTIAVTPNMVIVVDPTASRMPTGPVLGGAYSAGGASSAALPIPWASASVALPTKSFVDTGRRPKTTYTYSVVTTYPDSGPYRSSTSEVTTVTMPPGLPPAWITASTAAGTTVTLNWQAAPDATGYKVFRDNAPITTQPVRGTSFVDQGLKPGLYKYSVISYFVAEGAGEIEGELIPRPSVQVILSRCSSP